MSRQDTVTIHLRFSVETILGPFQDELIFTEIEWPKLDPAALDVAKNSLADTWVAFRSAQLAEEAALRTLEGKQAKILEIDAKIVDLTAAKLALEAKI